VRRGEIVGLYGLIGAGRSEFVLSVFGRHPKTSGEILWKGQPVDIQSERQAINLGIALLPESRRDQGLSLNMPIGFNINLPIYDRITRGVTISPRQEAERADRQINDLSIKTPSRRSLASSMSGGNQQKIVIGKWLNCGAELFLFDEPTVGVDVGTRAAIYEFIAELCAKGVAIVLISSDLPEILHLANRAFVFYRGKVQIELEGDAITEENVLSHFFEREAA
jgi:ribose transport system ATP-binding protein